MSKAYRRWKEKQKKIGKKYSFSLFRQNIHKNQKLNKDLKRLKAMGKRYKPITIRSYRFWNLLEKIAAGRIKPTADYSCCPYCYCKQKEKNNE